MRRWMGLLISGALIAGVSVAAFGQEKVKEATRDVAKETGKVAKKTGKGVKKVTKKVVNKGASAPRHNGTKTQRKPA